MAPVPEHCDVVATATAAAAVLMCRAVEWDAIEFPSQFMENWCYDRNTLDSFARHYQTGEPLPEEVFTRLREAKTFRSATAMLRQVCDMAGGLP